MRWFTERIRANTQGWPAYMAYCASTTTSPTLARFYGAGYPDPGMPISDVPLVALDLETTGLDAGRDAIISVATVPFSIRRIPLAERGYWLVRPPRDALDQDSVVIHHITHSALANAPEPSAVLPEVLEHLRGRIPVVHYRYMERAFLDAAARQCLGEPLQFPLIDTMGLEAERYRYSVRARLAQFIRRAPVSIRLPDSRQRYRLPRYDGHHAIHDAIGTAELLQAQIAWRYRPETPLSRLWF